MRLISIALGLVSALASQHAAAFTQDTEPPEDEQALEAQIIVEGERRLEPKELNRAIDTLTRRTGLFEPVARFQSSVCVLVIGLGEALDEKIGSRIRKNVSAVGLKLDKQDCRPNAITIITDSPQEVFSTIYMKRNHLIGHPNAREYSLNTIKSQLKANKPAISWSIFGAAPMGAALPLPASGASSGFWGWNSPQGVGGRPRRASVLLLDRKQLNGFRTDQIADFATVHLLGSPRTATKAGEARVPTILSLFDDGPKRAHRRLTTFDRAYLCGLYSMRNRSEILIVNTALNTRLNKSINDAYDSDCVRVGAPADEPAGDALPAPQPQPGLDTATKP